MKPDMNTLRDIETILRNACAGRIENDYAKLTAGTAMQLANAIAVIDKAKQCSCPCHSPNSVTILHDKQCCSQPNSTTLEPRPAAEESK